MSGIGTQRERTAERRDAEMWSLDLHLHLLAFSKALRTHSVGAMGGNIYIGNQANKGLFSCMEFSFGFPPWSISYSTQCLSALLG